MGFHENNTLKTIYIDKKTSFKLVLSEYYALKTPSLFVVAPFLVGRLP